MDLLAETRFTLTIVRVAKTDNHMSFNSVSPSCHVDTHTSAGNPVTLIYVLDMSQLSMRLQAASSRLHWANLVMCHAVAAPLLRKEAHDIGSNAHAICILEYLNHPKKDRTTQHRLKDARTVSVSCALPSDNWYCIPQPSRRSLDGWMKATNMA